MLDKVRSFSTEQASSVVLIRHDKRLEKPPHPRGGFVVGQELLPSVIRYFFGLGRIVAVCEEADPLLNGYNLNLLFESDFKIWIEIVGPGFDASDLQRGDVSPHEMISVSLTNDGEISELKRSRRVDRIQYERSVGIRKQKIKAKLESSPTPALARKIRAELGISDNLDTHLKMIGSPLCAAHSYHPIPEKVLRDTIGCLVQSDVVARYQHETHTGFPLVISSSFVNRGAKQVFWDIVSPSLKFAGLRSQ